MAEIEIPNPEEVREKAEDPFGKRVALAVAVYAVILAVSAAGGNNASKDMMMEQQKATNKWSQYQAKSIREALYMNDAEMLDIELAKGGLSGDARKKTQDALARMTKKVTEYKSEKEEIAAEARKHEESRDVSYRQDPYFDLAEVALQISIVLASVAMLSGKRWAFTASLVLAAVGLAFTVNGFFLLKDFLG